MFVVGNGPSLRWTPLDKLKGEICFATNRINLIYPYTDWRPTHYVRAEQADIQAPETYYEDMRLHVDELQCEVFCNVWFVKNTDFGKRPNVTILDACAHYQTNYDSEYCPHLWHLPRICTMGGSVNVAIQLAVQEGATEIILVGCDLGYKDGKPSHFDDQYETGLTLQAARYANMNALTAHIIAKRSSPVPIYNATLGGSLEVYERINYFEPDLDSPVHHTPGFAYR